MLDLGTGDGAAVIRRARREPRALVIGIDPNASAMREASRLAARGPKKGGLPNALFVVAAAESLPPELNGRVDELWITLPWGSLLRGAACAEPWLIEALQRIMRPRAEARVLLSVTARDAAMGLPAFDAAALIELAARYAAGGLEPVGARAATPADVGETGSGWARRLDIPRSRPAWWLQLRPRDQSGEPPSRPIPARRFMAFRQSLAAAHRAAKASTRAGSW